MNIFLIVLTLFLGACEKQPSSSDTNWTLTVFDPLSKTAHAIHASDATSKQIVINYWAEWCKPCIAEMPELNRFAAAHQDNIILLGVNFDNKKDIALQEAIQKVGMAFPAITTDPTKVFTLPEISGLPTTLILDEHGILKEQLLGPQTLESLETALLKPLLKP